MAHDGKDDRKQPSTRDRLQSLVMRGYDIGRTADDRVFIVPKSGPNVALFSGAAKARLAADHIRLYATTVGRTPLDETWMAVEGRALDVDKVELPLRVAQRGHDEVIIDLGTTDGKAIRVSAGGWQVVDRSPVTFRRSKAQRPLPLPESGGADWSELWHLLNLPKTQRDLMRAWMATALLRDIPHPILNVEGEQGASKSTFARQVSTLIDPCAVDSVSVPRDADSWATSAQARWVVSVDNVSKIEPWWSDDLCRTVTGSGRIKRMLYTDDDVTVVVNRAVVILNGITMAGAMRADLAERMLPLELTRPKTYLPESVISARFEQIAAGVLALILDDVATILGSEATPAIGDLRMADFAVCLGKLDAEAGTTSLATYRRLHQEHAEMALDADPVARCVKQMMTRCTTWTGQAHELLGVLQSERQTLGASGEVATDGYWPADATRMGSALTRSSALLQRAGIRVSRQRDTSGRRTITLTVVGLDADEDGLDAEGDGLDADADASVKEKGADLPTNPLFLDALDAVDTVPPVLAFLGEIEGEGTENAQGGGTASTASQRQEPLCLRCDAAPVEPDLMTCRDCADHPPQMFTTCGTCRRDVPPDRVDVWGECDTCRDQIHNNRQTTKETA